MSRILRQAVAPLYLFLCLILGGSAQGIWANMALQLFGVAIIAWAAMAPADERMGAPARQLLILVAVAVAVVAVQTLPLPPTLWPHLNGRERIAEGYDTLGLATPWLPISLTAYLSLDSLLGLIPPLALFCAMVRLRAYRTSWLVAALLAGTIAGVLLGAVQVASSDYASSPWYLYPESSFGVAIGFFANANHMAILLVTTLPFLAALLISIRGKDKQRNNAVTVGLSGVAVVILVGIVLNRSLAAYGLTLPVLAASALILLPRRSVLRRWTLVVAGLLLVGAIGVLVTSSTNSTSTELGSAAATSVQSRQEMLETSRTALSDFMPWGSGLGSFRSIYRLYEKPSEVTNIYVIHAHNDYVEVALEMGVAGVLLMLAFLIWWARASWRVWRSGEGGPYARAASIASAAILAHSIVDFPLRTAAISVVFAMCLALLVERRSQPAPTRSDLRPTRHVVLQ